MYKLKLIESGIPADIKGFTYLNTALEIYEPVAMGVIELYNTIANIYNDTPSRVERAIRHAISKAGKKIKNGNFIATHKILWGANNERQEIN